MRVAVRRSLLRCSAVFAPHGPRCVVGCLHAAAALTSRREGHPGNLPGTWKGRVRMASAAAAAAVVAAVSDADAAGMGLALAQVSAVVWCGHLRFGGAVCRFVRATKTPPACPSRHPCNTRHYSPRTHHPSHTYAQGELALACGEVPIGCVFVHPTTRAVLAAGQNRTNVDFNVRACDRTWVCSCAECGERGCKAGWVAPTNTRQTAMLTHHTSHQRLPCQIVPLRSPRATPSWWRCSRCWTRAATWRSWRGRTCACGEGL